MPATGAAPQPGPRSEAGGGAVVAVAGGVVPLGQEDDQVGVEALFLEGLDGGHDLLLLQVDHGEGTVAHAGQVEERVLHDGQALVVGDGHVMGALAGGDGLDELFSASCAEPDLRLSKAA